MPEIILFRAEGNRKKHPIQEDGEKLDIFLDRFIDNMTSIENKFLIINNTKYLSQSAIDDIYRSQVVFVESAMDYYFHEISIYATLEMYKGGWNKTDSYKQIVVSLDKTQYAITHPEDKEWISEVIVAHYAHKTCMAAKEIKGRIAFLTGKGVYDHIAKKMFPNIRKPEDYLSDLLDKYFKRRNFIAHQSDRDHITKEVQEISFEYVQNMIRDIRLFVSTCHNEIKDKCVKNENISNE